MPSLTIRTVGVIAYATASCLLSLSQAALIEVPLQKKTTAHGVSPLGRHRSLAAVPVIADQSLSILIDTGSPDLFLNPGLYQPSSASIDTGRSFSITFGTTNPDGSGTETVNGHVYEDTVTLDGTKLTISSQTLGETQSVVPAGIQAFPHDGLMGFFSPGSTLGSGVKNWFANLCAEKKIDQCRFALAFNTDNTGTMYIGGIQASAFSGSLTVAPIVDQWELFTDLAVNGKIIQRDVEISTDSGTTVTFGPIDSVQALFDAAGVHSTLHPSTSADQPTTLSGTYPCDSPPQFGFNFPSISNATSTNPNISHTSKIFNIVPAALEFNSTGNNCTASLFGTDEFDFWLVGQNLFEGKYVDHNAGGNTMGFANLKGF